MTAVFAIARDEVRAVRLLDDLQAAGASQDRISVVAPENAVSGGFGGASDAFKPGLKREPSRGVLGGALEGPAYFGLQSHSELGRVIGFGPLVATLGASATGARFTKALGGQLKSASLSGAEVTFYLRALANGKILVSVQCDGVDEANRIKDVLGCAGAENITPEVLGHDSICEAEQYPQAA